MAAHTHRPISTPDLPSKVFSREAKDFFCVYKNDCFFSLSKSNGDGLDPKMTSFLA